MKIAIELVMFGRVTEHLTVSAAEARKILTQPMNAGCRWRICLPDRTGELADDKTRYATDCKACGISNPLEMDK